MYDYALIVHPTNEELLYKYEPGLRRRSKALVKKVLEWMSPFKAAEVEGLNSCLGRTAKGALVMCPLLMEQMATLSPRRIMKAVINTLEFARLTLNPRIIGLTAYVAFPGNKGLDITKIINTPMTTGSNYTLATIPECILRAADLMEIELDRTSALVLGATSSVGKFCIEVLSHFVCAMYITAHNEDKLGLFLADLPREKRSKLHRITDMNRIPTEVNIVIVATNRIPPEFDINKLNPGTIIFDASYPRQISSETRDDVLVIDGVYITPPGNVEFNFDFGLPPHYCYPCMAEPMILALEKRFDNYSLGREFDPNKIREIMRLGAKHGFEISGLTSREKVIKDSEVAKIKNNSLKKRRRKLLLWR